MGLEIKNIDFNDISRLALSIIVIGGLIFVIIISLNKNNFEFAKEIAAIFSGWIGAIFLFFFQQKQIEEKSKQVEDTTSKVSAMTKSLDVSTYQEKKYVGALEFLAQKYPHVMDELLRERRL